MRQGVQAVVTKLALFSHFWRIACPLEAKRQQTQTDWGSDMTDVYSPKVPPVTRDLERRPRPDDYRPGIPARPRSQDWVADGPAMSGTDAPFDRSGEMDTGTAVNLRKLQEQLSRKPLD